MGKIGVFDSGYGGLSILKAVRSELPEYDYLYLGDNARAPYGVLDNETIYEYTKEAVDALFQQGCQLIILACNSASAVALRKLQQVYLPSHYPDRRVLGVLIPAAEIVAQKEYKNIGVMATPATVASKSFTAEIHKLSPGTMVIEQACPKLVPLIERHVLSGAELESALKEYIEPILSDEIEVIILGCTHYELIVSEIKKILPKGVDIVCEGSVVGDKLKEYLANHPEIEATLYKHGSVSIQSSSKDSLENSKKLFFDY